MTLIFTSTRFSLQSFRSIKSWHQISNWIQLTAIHKSKADAKTTPYYNSHQYNNYYSLNQYIYHGISCRYSCRLGMSFNRRWLSVWWESNQHRVIEFGGIRFGVDYGKLWYIYVAIACFHMTYLTCHIDLWLTHVFYIAITNLRAQQNRAFGW